MNRNLWLLALAQGLFLTNNVVFIGINGLVGLALAPVGWMATLPITGYVVGSALSTGWWRSRSSVGADASRSNWAYLPQSPRPYFVPLPPYGRRSTC